MGLHGEVSLEDKMIEKAWQLYDPSKVSQFVIELLNVTDLDVIEFYVKIEALYALNKDSATLYEILCRLGEMPGPTKGQTISRAVEQRKKDNHA